MNHVGSKRSGKFIPGIITDVHFHWERNTAVPSTKNSMTLWFKNGTEPEDSEPAKGEVGATEFLQVP